MLVNPTVISSLPMRIRELGNKFVVVLRLAGSRYITLNIILYILPDIYHIASK